MRGSPADRGRNLGVRDFPGQPRRPWWRPAARHIWQCVWLRIGRSDDAGFAISLW